MLRMVTAPAPDKIAVVCHEKGMDRFRGEVIGNTFSIRRWALLDSFLAPVIKGDIYPIDSGARVEVVMKLSAPMVVFINIWCFVFAMITVPLVGDSFGEQNFIKLILSVLGLIITFYLMLMGCWWVEMAKAKEFLRAIYAGK
jgi:cytochrome c oxidase subunit IV